MWQIIDATLSTASDSERPLNDTSGPDEFETNSVDKIENVSVQSSACTTNEIRAKTRAAIPTAIVKPKYQKTSFDDRQLPPVANVDREKPWYGDDSNTITVTTKMLDQLPPFERKSTDHLKPKSVHVAHAPPASEYVAIVQPRKKNNTPNEKQPLDAPAVGDEPTKSQNNGKLTDRARNIRPKPTPAPRSKPKSSAKTNHASSGKCKRPPFRHSDIRCDSTAKSRLMQLGFYLCNCSGRCQCASMFRRL